MPWGRITSAIIKCLSLMDNACLGNITTIINLMDAFRFRKQSKRIVFKLIKVKMSAKSAKVGFILKMDCAFRFTIAICRME